MTTDSRVLRALDPFGAGKDRGVVLVGGTDAAGVAWEFDCDQLIGYTEHRGREKAGQQFPAGLVTFSVPVDGAADLQRLRVGDTITGRVDVRAWYFLYGAQDATQAAAAGFDTDADRKQISATVTDLRISYRKLRAGRPPQAVLDVTAVGPKARAGQTLIGDTPWYQETVAQRKDRIEQLGAAAGWPGLYLPPLAAWTGGLSPDDAATVVSARDVDRQSALTLYEQLAGDVGAEVFESLRYEGRIMWAGIEWRSGRTAIATLRPEEVAATATWTQDLSGLVNKMSVEYGPAGARATVTVRDEASIAQFGEYATSRSTQLVAYAPAQRLAALTVGRNSVPAWAITRLDVDLLDLALPKAKARKLLRAEVGDLVELQGLPTSAPGNRWFYIEGAEMTAGVHDWHLTLYVSDAGRTGAPLAWEELSPTMTWADVPPEMSWLQAAGWFEGPPDTYRWVDVPGNQTWRMLAPGDPRGDADLRAPSWASYPENP